METTRSSLRITSWLLGLRTTATRTAGTAAALAVVTTAPAFGFGYPGSALHATSRVAACRLQYCQVLLPCGVRGATAKAATVGGRGGRGGVHLRLFTAAAAAAAASSPTKAASTAEAAAAAAPSQELRFKSSAPRTSFAVSAAYSVCPAAQHAVGTVLAGGEEGPHLRQQTQMKPSETHAAAAAAAATATATAMASTPSPLSFSDHRAVFEGQSTWDLLRAYGVLRACGFKSLVRHAEALLTTSRRCLGEAATNALVKSTFFSHFCAGENVTEIQHTVNRLRALGVGAILDYAAEDDVGPTIAAASNRVGPAGETVTASAGVAARPAEPSARALGVVGRTYDYASEEQCDRHVDHFLEAIEMAARQPGRPAFAAIKVTALGNPELLQRASSAIAMLHGLFSHFDEDGSGFIDRDEFQRQWQRLVGGDGAAAGVGEGALYSSQAEDTFRWLDMQGTGKVDYVSWCQRLDLRHMPMLAARIAEGGGGAESGSQSVAEACLDGQEVQLMDALLSRLQRLVAAALRLDVRLMIDAEHTYFQPAIEHVTLRLMREHNRDGVARVLNTYQAYLVDSRSRLMRDLERARREDWVLGAKLVRGAYLHLERRRAKQLGLPSPVWGSLEQTHANYDRCVEDLLAGVRSGRAEVLLGTHNQPSVEAAVACMAVLGLPPANTPGVMFGQLLGMSDHLTLTLGKAGYRAYKYVPYGRVGQVMPYLLRRAAENQDIMRGSKQDLVILRNELGRRLTAALRLGTAAV